MTDARRRATVSLETAPGEQVATALWEQYRVAFEPLQEQALLSHLYAEHEFMALFHDASVIKLIGWDGADPVGLVLLTNNLDVVPQISPPFLRHRYPELAEREAIYFGVLFFVATGYRGRTLFARLVAAAGQVVAKANGLLVFDVCRHNMETLALHEQIERVSTWFPSSSFEKIDTQAYFAARVPIPIDEAPELSPPAPEPAVA